MRIGFFAVIFALLLAAVSCGGHTAAPEMRIAPMGVDEIPEQLRGYDCFSYMTDGTVSEMTVQLWLCSDGEWEAVTGTRALAEAPDGIIALRCDDNGTTELVVANELLHRSVKPDGAPDFTGMASVTEAAAEAAAIKAGDEILLFSRLGWAAASDEKTVYFKKFRDSGCDSGLALTVVFEP